jgi:hypothetical protein
VFRLNLKAKYKKIVLKYIETFEKKILRFSAATTEMAIMAAEEDFRQIFEKLSLKVEF